jgi:hypothetical protein
MTRVSCWPKPLARPLAAPGAGARYVLHANEMRHLRHRDLSLVWRDGTIEQGWLTVSRSETEGGQGRTILLSKRSCSVLTLWISRFSDAPADGYLFPRLMVGLAGNNREPILYEVDFNRAGAK